MLAAQVSAFGRPEEAIEVVELADPGAPGTDEVLVEAEYFPINPADVLNLEGKYGAVPPRLPMIPGAEGVGRIVKAGSAVQHVKPGDRVLLTLLKWDCKKNQTKIKSMKSYNSFGYMS